MPRLTWGKPASRFFESGIDRGVLYVGNNPGVPWVGLTSVVERSTGGEPEPFYMDGVKYLNLPSDEEFEATINAMTYPDEFGVCDGTHQPRIGLFLTQQRRRSFGFSYRTKIGTNLPGKQHYKIHLVYNALASPSERSRNTESTTVEPTEFSWSITTKPPTLSSYHRTAHIVVDTRTTDELVLEALENYLYGTDAEPARLPSPTELIGIFDLVSSITVVDHGDGTFSITGPVDVVRMLDGTMFEVTSPDISVTEDGTTYTISS